MTEIDRDRISFLGALDEEPRLSETIAREEAPAGTSVRELATEQVEEDRKLPGRRARVVLEGPDGEPLEPFEVRLDNRDYVRWDKTARKQKWLGTKDDPTPYYLLATFVSWSAASRQGLTSLTWAQWEAACIEATALEEDDEDAAHPTR